MKRLAPGASGVVAGAAMMILVAGVLFLSAVFLVEGRTQLADRRRALLAATAGLSEIAFMDYADLHGLSGQAVNVPGGRLVTASVRSVSEDAVDVTVAASMQSGGRVSLAGRFYFIIE
jgi:hypothetical protein